MAAPMHTLLAQALELPDRERGALALELLRSLEPEDGDELIGPAWETAWTAEVDRRVAEIDDGTAELVDGGAVFAEVRAKLAARRR